MSARLRVGIRGAVQGVGFRPFVYRLATGLGLAGWVENGTDGVTLEVEGARATLESFLARVVAEAPGAARVHAVEHAWLDPVGAEGFTIRASDPAGARTTVVLPDRGTCAACLAEVRDPAARRHGYAFTNCTDCGPRFTIVRALPYDRPNTTMAGFPLCADCRREYEDPLDRRFHAQPVACPACGPRLALWDAAGVPRAAGPEALAAAARALAAGEVVAVKGLGGFHLMCDAADEAAVARLRAGKARRAKPFALLCADVAQARALVEVDDAAAAVLESPESPIVLLPRVPGARVAAGVAPGLAELGVMLPCTPLHHLLMDAVSRPLVATSGNVSDEPIVTDEREARARLGGMADAYLVHDRPIERHVDDSVGAFVHGAFRLLRRSRGYAPLPVRVARAWPCVLAVGPHQKDTVALAVGRDVFVSQHIGDLETPEAADAFERVAADLMRLYEAAPVAIAHDLHPDHVSTRWALDAARARGVPAVAVQHHHAHLASALAEHALEGPALGIVWDGTGLGPDGTVWGGEFLAGDARAFTRVAHLATFRLPGGEAAVREPRRVALALLWELMGEAALEREDLAVVAAFTRAERAVLARLLAGGPNTPRTSSAGRLFDGLAALVGLQPRVTYEGEAAIAFEQAAEPGDHGAYPLPLLAAGPDAPRVVDWRPLVEGVLSDLARGVPRGIMSARAHAAMVDAMTAVAGAAGLARVALSGGCFQNRRLTAGAARALEAAGHEVVLHRAVPPNDGGVSLGQAAIAAARMMGS